MSTRVLTTGGAGFVGSQFAERLPSRGTPVLVLDNLSRKGTERNLQYPGETYGDFVEPHTIDIGDRRVVEESVARRESVSPFAAQVAATTSLANPAEDFESNLVGTGS